MKKIIVDWDRCEANGVCVKAAPEAFHLDEADRLHVLVASVTPALHEGVDRAIARCPRQALALAPQEVTGDTATPQTATPEEGAS